MANNLSFLGKRAGALKFGSQSSVAQRQAIDSFQNIANAQIDLKGNPDSAASEEERMAAVLRLLGASNDPVPVAEVAALLGWAPPKAADVLAKGGQAGLLQFSTVGDSTAVSLVQSDLAGAAHN